MPPTSNDVHLIAGSDLQRFASALFQALGVAGPMADEWARSLVWANLRGVDSHGVGRDRLGRVAGAGSPGNAARRLGPP